MRKPERIVLTLLLTSLFIALTIFNMESLRVTKEFQKMETVKIKIVNDENQARAH